MTFFLSVLPWLVVAVVVLAFSLADDLPAPEVRRIFLVIGIGISVVTAALSWYAPDAAGASYVFAALGPLGFLLFHHVLRTAFRTWKGGEPVLVATGGSGSGSGRFSYEKGVPRQVQFLDYLYTFLLGCGMLLAAAPAIARVVDAS